MESAGATSAVLNDTVLACAATGATRPRDGTSTPSPKSTARATRPTLAAHIGCGEPERPQRVRGMETPLSLIVPDRQAQSSTVFDSVSKTVEGVEARVNVASFDLAVSASG